MSFIINPYVFAGAAWTPADLPDIIHWYRTREIVGLSNDDPVSSWEDLIGSADMSGSSTTRPLYKTGGGDPYLHFDGTDDKLTLSPTNLTGDYALVFIWQYHAKKAYGMLLGNSGQSLQISYDNTNDAVNYIVPSSFSLTRSIPSAPTGDIAGYFERSGTTGKLRINGSETTGTVGTGALGTSWLVGEFSGVPGTYQGDIDLKEVIVCDAPITGGDFTDLAAYINSEYGLTL